MFEKIPHVCDLTAAQAQADLPVLAACQTHDFLLQAAEVLVNHSGGIEVLASPPIQCAQCAASGGCSAGLFARLGARSPARLFVPFHGDVALGSWVWLGLPKVNFLKTVFMLYFLPIALAVLGTVFGFAFRPLAWHPDVSSGLGLAVGLLVGCGIARYWTARQGAAGVVVLWPAKGG